MEQRYKRIASATARIQELDSVLEQLAIKRMTGQTRMQCSALCCIGQTNQGLICSYKHDNNMVIPVGNDS